MIFLILLLKTLIVGTRYNRLAEQFPLIRLSVSGLYGKLVHSSIAALSDVSFQAITLCQSAHHFQPGHPRVTSHRQ